VLKNLILIENGEKYQFDTFKELIKSIIDKNYYEMSVEDKAKKIELKAFANCMKEKVDIITKKEEKNNIEGKFVAIDEVTYIYSLLIFNKVMLLESTDSNILAKGLEKSNISENYLVLNRFAKELLQKYLENI